MLPWDGASQCFGESSFAESYKWAHQREHIIPSAWANELATQELPHRSHIASDRSIYVCDSNLYRAGRIAFLELDFRLSVFCSSKNNPPTFVPRHLHEGFKEIVEDLVDDLGILLIRCCKTG